MRAGAAASLLAALAAGGAAATPEQEAAKGPVTGLPLPRYVSLKSSEANVRRGPGLSHRVDWVFLRRGMPLQITAEHGHWRRVRDMDDATGWVHYSLLRGNRTAVVVADDAALREAPAPDARPVARVESGVILALDACGQEWCEASAEGHEGWIRKASVWGVEPAETFD